MRIALLGSRGIPARYGGYETLMEEIAVLLASWGHEVTVYCRSHYTAKEEREHHGVRLVVLPTIRGKYFDTPVHTLLSSLHAAWVQLHGLRRGRGYDAALMVNAANAFALPILRLAGLPVALHVDGIEKRRAKWGPLGRLVYAISERLAVRLPSALVTDAEVIEEHYRERYGASSRLITYGVDPRPPKRREVLERLGLSPGSYFLYVSRIEPENNPHRVLEGYARVGGDMPLVLVGDAPYSSALQAELRRLAAADRRVILPGAIYGEGYRELQAEAFAYIHATEVGGTHPALVEAMGYGNALVVNDTPENREVAGPEALYFRAAEPASLAKALEILLAEPERAALIGTYAANRARERYSWQAVARKYEALFRDMAEGKSAVARPGG